MTAWIWMRHGWTTPREWAQRRSECQRIASPYLVEFHYQSEMHSDDQKEEIKAEDSAPDAH